MIDPVGKQEAVLSLQQLLGEGKPHHVVDSGLRGGAVDDSLEGVLCLRGRGREKAGFTPAIMVSTCFLRF